MLKLSIYMEIFQALSANHNCQGGSSVFLLDNFLELVVNAWKLNNKIK